MEAVFFRSAEEMRAWLRQHHACATELLAGFYKKGSGQASLTWPESVDEALCVGWIDGVRKNLDAARYTIRFTPRRKSSIWSAVNIGRVSWLIEQGRMQPEGLKAFEARTEKRSAIYAYEQKETACLSETETETFRSHARAWEFFEAQAPWYRRTLIWWVVSAKQEKTRLKRLDTLIRNSEQGIRLR
ncbi:MAG: YdeI/OmpD-associated family protein [Acidobacteriota bacterium]